MTIVPFDWYEQYVQKLVPNDGLEAVTTVTQTFDSDGNICAQAIHFVDRPSQYLITKKGALLAQLRHAHTESVVAWQAWALSQNKEPFCVDGMDPPAIEVGVSTND